MKKNVADHNDPSPSCSQRPTIERWSWLADNRKAIIEIGASIVRTTLEIGLALADRFFGFYLYDFVAVAIERDEKSSRASQLASMKMCYAEAVKSRW